MRQADGLQTESHPRLFLEHVDDSVQYLFPLGSSSEPFVEDGNAPSIGRLDINESKRITVSDIRDRCIGVQHVSEEIETIAEPFEHLALFRRVASVLLAYAGHFFERIEDTLFELLLILVVEVGGPEPDSEDPRETLCPNRYRSFGIQDYLLPRLLSRRGRTVSSGQELAVNPPGIRRSFW